MGAGFGSPRFALVLGGRVWLKPLLLGLPLGLSIAASVDLQGRILAQQPTEALAAGETLRSLARPDDRVIATVGPHCSGAVLAAATREEQGPPGLDQLTAREREVLALQKEVARDVVNNINVQVTTQEQARLGRTRPVNPDAYDHYLRGQFYLHRQNRDDNELAIKALEQAVDKDPDFAAAFADLAQAYVWKLFLFSPEEKDLPAKAFVAVQKALALDPDLAVAYLARGRLLWTPENRFPHARVIGEYRRALSLDPNLDEARNQLALVYCHIGAFQDALRESQDALASNPANSLVQFR